MPDYERSFKDAYGDEGLAFLTEDDITPIGVINFFDGPFSSLFSELLPIQVLPLISQNFLDLAVSEYGLDSIDGWRIIIEPYIEDLNSNFFTPRSTAVPPPLPTVVTAPIIGSSSKLYSSILSSTEDPEASRKFTNALFQAVISDLISAGPAGVILGKPLTVSPYVPV